MPFKKAATNTDEDNGSNSDTSQMRMTPTVMQEPFHSKKTAIKEKSGGNQWFQNLSSIFQSRTDEVQTESSSKVVLNKSLCECEKDQGYKFACKHAIQWFAQTVIKNKIRRRANEKLEDVILDEYHKCKKVYRNLKLLKPKRLETQIQIDRDLSRTFPKNDYFKGSGGGQKKLSKVLTAFACYDDKVDYV